MKWWQAALVSGVIFVVLNPFLYNLFESLLPVTHMPYDFGGDNLARSLWASLFVANGVGVYLAKSKRIYALIASAIILGLLLKTLGL